MPTITKAEVSKEIPANDTRPALKIWTLTLDDGRTAEIARRPDSPVPSGSVEVEQTEHGLKAKMPRQGGPGRGRSPEETKAIQRQHSQEMALRWMAIQAQRGKVPDDIKLDGLKPVIDWFEKDISS